MSIRRAHAASDDDDDDDDAYACVGYAQGSHKPWMLGRREMTRLPYFTGGSTPL